MHTIERLAALIIFAIVGTVSPTKAQLVREFNPPKTRCCLPVVAQRLSDELQDWNDLSRYHADDLKLQAQASVPGRVVFLGDSITAGWHLADYFPGKPYVNRGIGGQTTPQMLVRMFPDVIDLKPAAVIILAGTNDIAQNTGPETATMIEENLRAITELARAHHIQVVLCTLTPVSDYTVHPQRLRRPAGDILELNAWIKGYTRHAHATLADYYSAVVDAKGMFKEGYSKDGLHPNARGFTLLAPIAEAAIEKALRKGPHRM